MKSPLRVFKWATIAAACTLAGCGGGPKGPECAPVQGTITRGGKPLVEAMVVLHRVGGDVEGHQKPMGYTNTSGKFILTTYKHNDGAPPGEYVVTVELRALQTIGEEASRSGPNTLPPKYAKPESAGIKYTVIEGDNQIPTIEIK